MKCLLSFMAATAGFKAGLTMAGLAAAGYYARSMQRKTNGKESV